MELLLVLLIAVLLAGLFAPWPSRPSALTPVLWIALVIVAVWLLFVLFGAAEAEAVPLL